MKEIDKQNIKEYERYSKIKKLIIITIVQNTE